MFINCIVLKDIVSLTYISETVSPLRSNLYTTAKYAKNICSVQLSLDATKCLHYSARKGSHCSQRHSVPRNSPASKTNFQELF